jgi:hypothetical protein
VGGGGLGWSGSVGLDSQEVLNTYLIFEFKWISDVGKTLEICTSRFRRNLDMGIFPKIFKASQGILENGICHAMIGTLRKNYLEKGFTLSIDF